MRRWWRCLWVLALALALSIESPTARSQQSTPPTLAERLDPLIRDGLSELDGARIGVHIRTLDGEVLYSREAGESFNTASNTKIVTAAAAMARLGPGFQFTTSLWAEGLDPAGTSAKVLYLKGGGDPLLRFDDVRGLVRDLVISGVKRVGKVVVDDSYFDGEALPPHYDEQPEEDASFRAPVSAAGVAFAAYTLHLVPATSGSGPAQVILDPETDYLELLEASVTTVRRGRNRIRLEQETRNGRLEIRISGQIRAGSTRRFRRRVDDPTAYAGSFLKTALLEAGIAVASRKVGVGEVSPRAELVASYDSPKLGVLIRGLGKYSNNFMAEVLLKTMGAEAHDAGAPGTWEKGLEVVNSFLIEELGFKKGSFRYGNGSGLFESNRFTPEQIARVLVHGATDFRSAPELIASLATGGIDGTLRSRLEDSIATGRVRAKTGTLAEVSALSGYAGLDPRDVVVFSILVNQIPRGEVSEARRMQDRIAERLVEFIAEAKQPR